MKLSEEAQELLEILWISSHEKSNPESASDYEAPASQELLQLGWASQVGGALTLTERGDGEAALAIRRHRLAERLLADLLDTDEDILDERACRLEHALFDGVDESICTLLGHPQVCPHGKAIPRGPCCSTRRETISRLILPLRETKRNQTGQIAYLHMDDLQHLNKLMAMGILPGVQIRIRETFPSYVFEAGHSQFAVDEGMAEKIFIRLNDQN